MVTHLLQYCCLEDPMDRGAWWATVHRATVSQTRLSDSMRVCVCVCVYKMEECSGNRGHWLSEQRN